MILPHLSTTRSFIFVKGINSQFLPTSLLVLLVSLIFQTMLLHVIWVLLGSFKISFKCKIYGTCCWLKGNWNSFQKDLSLYALCQQLPSVYTVQEWSDTCCHAKLYYSINCLILPKRVIWMKSLNLLTLSPTNKTERRKVQKKICDISFFCLPWP